MIVVINIAENSLTDRAKRHVLLAQKLSKRFEVKFLTSNFDHAHKKHIDHTNKLENEIFFSVAGYHGHFSIWRFITHVQFSLKVLWYLLSNRPTHIIVSSIPPEIVFVCALYKLVVSKSTQIYLDIRDIWPEAFTSLRKKNFLIKKVVSYYFNIMNSFSRSQINKAVLTNIDFKKSKLVTECNVVIPLGYDPTRWENFPAPNRNRSGVVYIGNFTEQFDITAFDLELLSNAFGPVTAVGEGPLREKYADVELLQVLGRVSFDFVPDILSSFRYGLLPVTGEATFPNKIYDYYLSGLSIVSNSRASLESLKRPGSIVEDIDGKLFLLKHDDLNDGLFKNYEQTVESIENFFFN